MKILDLTGFGYGRDRGREAKGMMWVGVKGGRDGERLAKREENRAKGSRKK